MQRNGASTTERVVVERIAGVLRIQACLVSERTRSPLLFEGGEEGFAMTNSFFDHYPNHNVVESQKSFWKFLEADGKPTRVLGLSNWNSKALRTLVLG